MKRCKDCSAVIESGGICAACRKAIGDYRKLYQSHGPWPKAPEQERESNIALYSERLAKGLPLT